MCDTKRWFDNDITTFAFGHYSLNLREQNEKSSRKRLYSGDESGGGPSKRKFEQSVPTSRKRLHSEDEGSSKRKKNCWWKH